MVGVGGLLVSWSWELVWWLGSWVGGMGVVGGLGVGLVAWELGVGLVGEVELSGLVEGEVTARSE